MCERANGEHNWSPEGLFSSYVWERIDLWCSMTQPNKWTLIYSDMVYHIIQMLHITPIILHLCSNSFPRQCSFWPNLERCPGHSFIECEYIVFFLVSYFVACAFIISRFFCRFTCGSYWCDAHFFKGFLDTIGNWFELQCNCLQCLALSHSDELHRRLYLYSDYWNRRGCQVYCYSVQLQSDKWFIVWERNDWHMLFYLSRCVIIVIW